MAERIRRWRLRARTAMTVLATGALVVAGAVAGPEQAEAASTTLCSGTAYTSCTSQGYPDYGYGINSSTSYWNQIAGHNCTNYVAYRLIQNGLSTTKPWSSSGNALTWGTINSSITDRTPAIGAIAWWAKSASLPNGHVAYVEYVDSTQIVLSEDNYSSGPFRWRSIPNVSTDSSWPTGFIHFADQSTVSAALPVGWIAKVTSMRYWTDESATVAASLGTARPGSRIYAVATVLNAGGQTWTDVALAAASPADAATTIADSSWPSTTTTPAQIQQSVPPGASATIAFWVRVPAGAAPGAAIVQTLRPVSASAGPLTSAPARVSLTVRKLATKATITLKKGIARGKSSGTIAVSLISSPRGSLVRGTVRIKLDGKTKKLAKVFIKSRGSASVAVSGLKRGTHTITISYPGSSSQKKVTATKRFRVKTG